MGSWEGKVMAVPQWPFRIVEWFRRDHRPMPWRKEPTAYNVWISEIMLQQTRVATVIPYFDRFVARFPDVRSLAAARMESVLLEWEGLGYYSRARHLHEAARRVVLRHGGEIPRSSRELLQLPGIGAYTAAAIASIAFGEPIPAVDGNVLRVMARFWGLDTPIQDGATMETVRKRLLPLIRLVDPSCFNQALMETGALVCTPRQPKCGECMLAGACVAFRTGRTEELPARRTRKKLPHHDMVAGVVRKRGRVLIVRREGVRLLEGLWEFPNGRNRPGEPATMALGRILFAEAGLRVRPGKFLVVRHAYSHFSLTMHVFECEWLSGRLPLPFRRKARWVPVDSLRAFPMSRVGRRIAVALVSRRQTVNLNRLRKEKVLP